MNKNKVFLSIVLCSNLLYADEVVGHNQTVIELEQISVVGIAESQEPLKVITDPKNPIQPIPASDGADYLKNIPGFSVIRKGGTDGDPVLRGMSGSRVGILIDGQEIYGGCGGRMDPPTAYIFPEAYDQVTVIKGPQTVLNGSGFSAGTVQFEKKVKHYTDPDYNLYSSFKQGSFGRSDQFVDVSGGVSEGYAQMIATRSHSNNYKDGNGDTVNSEYTRWNTGLTVGFTPNDNTVIELSASKGDGEAKYADRTMDASKLERENLSLKVIEYDLADNVEQLEFQAYHNYVDHIMDNYTLRSAPVVMGSQKYSAMNPDRTTEGGKIKLTTTIPNLNATNITGIDFKKDEHTGRSAMMRASASAADDAMFASPRVTDFDFKQMGIFDESTFKLDDHQKIITGLRVDKHEVTDKRATFGMLTIANPNYLHKDEATLTSGFARYENKINDMTYYVGVGYSERFPDYWERTVYNLESNAARAFIPQPEKTNQLDIGTHWSSGNVFGSLSAFYSKVDDYIQTRWLGTNGKPLTVPYGMGTTSYSKVTNVDATLYGGEMELGYKITPNYKVLSALSYVHGQNDTENKPLAQQPPLELKLSAMYEDNIYAAGVLARFATKQDRYDVGNGNIVMMGMDTGETPGFAVFSVNGSYKYSKNVIFSAGIDNIFDKAYAEHLSRTDPISSLVGYTGEEKIKEPGRNFWLEVKIKL
ncbi:TonB-dependent copper receptor [Sulfurospirillum sp.]|uniref:TonB-dependent copper receptor n=1 Tax=Sulfurospirillum sp. TaxID=2053622 RepID=UPI002FDD4BC8